MNLRSIIATLALTIPSLSHADDLTKLADWMTGSFNSKAQSISNESYYNINLEMAQIWPDSKGAIWLYVEQAVATSLDKPYRQRIYKLEQQGDKYISTVYSLPNPSAVVGAWQHLEKLKGLTPDSLLLRKGCHINITHKKSTDTYTGSTDEKHCSSKLRGASYATSHVEIKSDVLTSWDQGFDEADKQVWGAIEGPYIFDKVKNYSVK